MSEIIDGVIEFLKDFFDGGNESGFKTPDKVFS